MSNILYRGEYIPDNTVLKVAGVDFYLKDIIKHYNDNKIYIIKSHAIYQVFYSENAGFYSNKVYTTKEKLVGIGRHHIGNIKFAHDLSDGFIPLRHW